jgi:hypothetical protein
MSDSCIDENISTLTIGEPATRFLGVLQVAPYRENPLHGRPLGYHRSFQQHAHPCRLINLALEEDRESR